MTLSQQEIPIAAAETVSEMARDGGNAAPPVQLDGLQKERERQRERLEARQVELSRHRLSVEKGIADLQRKLSVTFDGLPKRLELRSKLKVLEDRLQELDQEQSQIDREGESLARAEQEAAIEHHLRTRVKLQAEGIEVAAKMRQALGVVQHLFVLWRDLQEADRKAKDSLRSLAPERMTSSPEFAWITACDGNFQAALAQVLGEYHRAEKVLATRQGVSTAP